MSSVNGTLFGSLFTIDSPSKAGQAEAAVVAAFYLLALFSLMLQVTACKGKFYAVTALSLFAAARSVGYIIRALAAHKVTKGRYEAYLILSSAATFLFIGAIGSLLSHWLSQCSALGNVTISSPLGHKWTAAKMMRLLHVAGVVFAGIGIVGAVNLFSASTAADVADAQHSRTISNAGFVALMSVYTVLALGCAASSWQIRYPSEGRRVSSHKVMGALSVACGLLLIRTVFGLLAVDHHQFISQSDLLYTLEVLPELLALYIVAYPGFLPAVGPSTEANMNQQDKTLPAIERAAARSAQTLV